MRASGATPPGRFGLGRLTLSASRLVLAASLVPLLGGCGRIQGNLAPLRDFGDLARRPNEFVGERVRTFAVLEGFETGLMDLGQGLGQRYSVARAFRADVFGARLCDPSQRSGARFTVLVPEGLAAQLKANRPDTVYALVGAMKRRSGAGGFAPTPVWLEVDQAVPMRTCERPLTL